MSVRSFLKRYKLCFFVCLLILIIALVLIITMPFQKTTTSSTFTSAPGGILFITAENQGLNLTESRISSFSNICNLAGTFSKVVIIALADSHVNPTDFYNDVETKLKAAGMTNFEYWLQIDTTKSYSICGQTKNIDTCADNIQQAINKWSSKKHPITGLYFDYEGVPGPGENGGIDIIIKSMEKVKTNNPKIKLAWTKGINSCAQNCPHPQYCQLNWDYCMGQSYTDTTSELYYADTCGDINPEKLWEKWDNIKSDRIGFKVPLVCLGGNCQGDLPNYLKGAKNSTCDIDERLDENGLNKLIASIDVTKYPNLGFWFGAGVKDHCPCTTIKNKGC